MLRPTPGDPWGVEQHHWNTGAEENQQLNPGGPSNRQGRGRKPLGDKVLMSTRTSCHFFHFLQNKKISNDQKLIQSDPTSCPQNQKGNN